MSTDAAVTVPAEAKTIVIQNRANSPWIWILGIGLAVMTLMCFVFLITSIAAVSGASATTSGSIVENLEDGSASASDKIAVIDIVGTISPPLTGRVINQVEHARDDEAVKAVLLRIDSPGGFVADSHQIYHELKKLSDAKPVYASFGRLAASGGYYVAMGVGPEGKIFAEPTSWTGSIGVIIPHYQVSELTDKLGVKVTPLTTGEFKDALSPFKELSTSERQLWDTVMEDAFARFRGVIQDNRTDLDAEAVSAVATGQIFTSGQAIERKLVDVEGFEEDALDTMKSDLSLTEAKVVRYGTPPTLLDALMGNVSADRVRSPEAAILESLQAALTPQPMFLFGWPTTMPQ